MRRSYLTGCATLGAALLWAASTQAQAQPAAEPAAPAAEEPAPAAAEPAPAPAPEPPPPAAEPAPEPPPPPPPPPPAAEVPPPPPPPPAAPVLVPTGSFFTRYELKEHYRKIGVPDTDAFKYRARFGFNIAPMELAPDFKVSVRFVPQSSGTWGIGGDTTDDATLGLHEGYVAFGGAKYRIDVGRMELNYGDALVIGNVGWHPTGRSFDAVRVHTKPGDSGMYVDTFLSVLKEGNVAVPAVGTTPALPAQTEPFATDDVYFGGVYAGFGPALAEGLELDGYGLAKVATVSHDATGTKVDETTRFTLGVRAKQKLDMIDYRAEAGVQFGSAAPKVSVFAYQIDAEVGVTVMEGKLRLAGEGFLASGNDPKTADKMEAWDHLYPTAHKWLGYMDIFVPRSNIAGGALHLAYGFAPDWKLAIDGHFFLRPQDAATPAGGVIKSGYAGTEIDTGIAYTLAKGLALRGAYDIFLPNKDRFGTTDAVHFVETELNYAF